MPGQRDSFRSRSSSSRGAPSSSFWRVKGVDTRADVRYTLPQFFAHREVCPNSPQKPVCYDCKCLVKIWLYDKNERPLCRPCVYNRKLGNNTIASDQPADASSGLQTNTGPPGRWGDAEQPEPDQQEPPKAVGSSSALWNIASSSHTTALSMAGLARQKLARFFLEVDEDVDGLAYGDENGSGDWSSEDGTDIGRSNASTPAPLPLPFEVSDVEKGGL